MLGKTRESVPQTYETLAQIWRKHNHTRPLMLAPNTRLRAETFWDKAEQYYVSAFAIELYGTKILWFLADGRIIINTGGYNTATTRQRINKFLPEGWRVFNRDGELFIRTPDDKECSYDYSDLNIFDTTVYS